MGRQTCQSLCYLLLINWLQQLRSQSIQLTTKCTSVRAPSRWQRPESIFSLVIKVKLSGYRTRQKTQQRQRKTVTISRRETINKAINYSMKFTRVAKSKELVPQIFSPANLILEEEKRVLPLILLSNRTCRQRSGRLTW